MQKKLNTYNKLNFFTIEADTFDININANEVLFVNNSDGDVRIVANGYIELAPGEQISFSGRQGAVLVEKFNILFNLTNTSNKVQMTTSKYIRTELNAIEYANQLQADSVRTYADLRKLTYQTS
jgi:hypothetical protein